MATEHRKGDKVQGIPTDDWNEFARTSKIVSQLVKNPVLPAHQSGADRLTVQVFNTSGALIDAAFPILKLSAPTFTFEDRESVIYEGILFDGETPDEDTDIGDIVIIQGPIQDEGFGSGVLIGHSWCEIEVTDTDHTHAAPSDAENTKLTSGTSGAKILWKESGEGTKKALVLLGGGGSSSSEIHSGRVTTEIPPATDWGRASWGTGGYVQELDDDGVEIGAPIGVLNRTFDGVLVDTPVEFRYLSDGTAVVLVPFCNQHA